jgi:predicted CXXCH cytochrome family protein
MKMSLLNRVMQRMGGGAALALLAVGVVGSGPAQAAIKDTKHNLSTSNTISGANKLSSSGTTTTEICVFCHTPHGSDTSAAVPLWNKKLNLPTNYTTYNSLGTSSLDGLVMPVGSVSLACLSCHDGSQALNVMINAPGSGGYNSAGAQFGTMASGGTVDTSTNALSAGIITNIGTDLRNDHPVGVQYGGGPKTATSIPSSGDYDNSLFRDAGFNTAHLTSANSLPVWWVDSEATPNSTREKTDMQLYTRKYGTLTKDDTTLVDQPFVECASCHDPHSSNTTFLRTPNTQSAVCLACHIK